MAADTIYASLNAEIGLNQLDSAILVKIQDMSSVGYSWSAYQIQPRAGSQHNQSNQLILVGSQVVLQGTNFDLDSYAFLVSFSQSEQIEQLNWQAVYQGFKMDVADLATET